MVQGMARELWRLRYIAATSEVLLDRCEDFSETQVQVVKNLHVCYDCHASVKCISQVYNQDIAVRGQTRFHRFRVVHTHAKFSGD
jgi:hypothetical protein